MAQAARIGDSVAGTTAGEHSGHTGSHRHGALAFSGEICGGCSADVFINGAAAAMKGSETIEFDSCCGSSGGSVGAGSATVFINGKPAARNGDALNAHSGSGTVTSGSVDVLIGG